MAKKPVNCPICGEKIKLFEIGTDTKIEGEPLEIKCRGWCKEIILITGNGEATPKSLIKTA